MQIGHHLRSCLHTIRAAALTHAWAITAGEQQTSKPQVRNLLGVLFCGRNMLQPKTAQISPTMKNGAKRLMSMLPKQRKRAGAIVREADHELCPVESAAPEFIL